MSYEPYYPGGFKDLPDTTTPVPADFLNRLEAAVIALEGRAAPGITAWAPGTYRKGWAAIHAGSLYIARQDTTDAPIVGQPIASGVSGDGWQRNGTGATTGDVVNVMEGPIPAASSPVAPTVIERATHSGLVGTTLTIEARVSSANAGSASYGLALGVINADRPTSQQTLISTGSTFWGWYLTPQGFRYYANNAGGAVGAAGAGLGVFDWSTLSVEYAPVDASTMAMILSRNGTELRRQTVPIPAYSTFRTALGSFINGGAAVPVSEVHSVRGLPSLGGQSQHWRRVAAVADIT